MIEAQPSRLIERTRQEIDTVDSLIAALLLRRRALSERIISFRIANGGTARDVVRERRVLENARKHAGSVPEALYLQAMFGCLLAEALTP